MASHISLKERESTKDSLTISKEEMNYSGIFNYYKSLECYLCLARYSIVSKDIIEPSSTLSFLDLRLILDTVSTIRFEPIDLNASNTAISRYIQSYLDTKYTDIDSDAAKRSKMWSGVGQFR